MKPARQNATIESLPEELLALIFESVPCSFPTTDPAASVSPIFTLTEVCHLWQTSALASSELWANIHARPPIDSDSDAAISVMWKIVKECVARSVGRPLTLTIDERLDQHTIVEELQKSGVNLDLVVELNAFSHTMNGILSTAMDALLEMRCLQRVYLTGPRKGMAGADRVSWSLSAHKFNPPLLAHFAIDVQFSDEIPYYCILPYHLLTHLTVTIHAEHVISAFLSCAVLDRSKNSKNLRNLSICAPFSRCSQAAVPLRYRPLEIPALKSFSILAPRSTIWVLLRQLEFGSLDRLHLSELWEPPGSQQSTEDLIQHFLTHRPLLKCLSTRRVDVHTALKLVQKCMPHTVDIAHAFSSNEDMTRAACQLVQDIVEGKESVACVRELTFHDLSRRITPGALFLKEIAGIIEELALVLGGRCHGEARPETTVVVRSNLPQARDVKLSLLAVQALAANGITFRSQGA